MLHHIENAENTSAGQAQTQPVPPPPGPAEGTETANVPSPAPDPHLIPPPSLPSSLDAQPSTLNPQPPFPLFPGETPRAFSAFMTFLQLGHGRSLSAVADQLGERLGTTKKWSGKFRWNDRIQSFNSGLLQQQAEAQAASRQKQAADWARRTAEQRELEWAASQKLRAAAQCFLESFGDREVSHMTLGQVSRALTTSSRLARLALGGATGPEEPVLAPLQLELAAALNRAYAQPPQPPFSASDGEKVDEVRMRCPGKEETKGVPTLNPQPSTQNS